MLKIKFFSVENVKKTKKYRKLSIKIIRVSFAKFSTFYNEIFLTINFLTVKMTKNLIKFHKNCLPEFEAILKKFNLLFYGYGCKRNLLQELFPKAFIFNCELNSLQNIVDELILSDVCKNPHKSILKIDEELFQRKKSIILICLNFNFSMIELQNLKAIKLIGTLEKLDFTHDQDDIFKFNFIHRDLTTFENYTEETICIDLYASKASSSLMVFKSVSEASQKIFKQLVIFGSCTIDKIFQEVKKKLMISKKNVILELLHEFFDHDIVKLKESNYITLSLNAADRNTLLATEEFKNINL